jgi:hypothetical protein
VLCWTSYKILRSESLDDRTELEIKADLLYAFDSVTLEDLGPEREKFESRKLEMGELLQLSDMEESAFSYLQSIGSTAGYYLKARTLISEVDLTERISGRRDFDKLEVAFSYLNDRMDLVAEDGRCLYLLLQLWWLTRTSFPLFYGERQVPPFTDSDWVYLLNLTQQIVQSGQGYRISMLLYLQSVALFHLGDFERSLAVFREISYEPEETQGRRRIIRSILASNAAGTPRLYSGTVRWTDGAKGELFIEEIGRNIRFLPHEFIRSEIRIGETLANFHIAFNFIGPIAEPSRFLRRGK